ncbi:MAG: 4-(cytidine 5'-diphospho)-2-C-methyl-D-erythritol kinase [Planctomycetaceae bacterium]|nr:4-(cytidine 5'-diphospho)-2-C-methyl-D-erythritol kinase [Planctomycetaceae bacterium]
MYVLRRRTRLDIWAPAKLNLYLEVLDRRADGFHEIETLMVSVSLFDRLCLTSSDDEKISLRCHWVPGYGETSDLGELPADSDNLVMRALNRLREASGIQAGLQVELQKRIPTSAGLGGGSSDAAAALVGANRLWQLNWPRERLTEIAAELGSDVPYFFFGTPAVCRGRGEQIEPIESELKQHVVIIRPPEGLSTPAVYKQVDLPSPSNQIQPTLACMQGRQVREISRHMFNRLQPAAIRVSPWIGRLQREFDRLDVLGHQMSGSGSSYFGFCRSAQHARRISSMLRARCPGRVFEVTTLPGSQRCIVEASKN